MDFVSWDDDIPNIWKVKKIHGSKPPTSYIRNWVITGLFILVAIMVGSQKKLITGLFILITRVITQLYIYKYLYSNINEPCY